MLDASERANVAGVATVMLVMFTVVVGTGVLVVGGSAFEETTDEMEERQMQQAFLELDRTVDEAVHAEDGTRRATLELPSGSDGIVYEKRAGRIQVAAVGADSREVLVDRTIGAVTYENDGVVYTYQAGAVWHGAGRGTAMVSPPDVQYRGATLTLTMTDVVDADGDASGAYTVEKRRTVAPLTDVGSVEDKLLELRITSKYYAGWADYFRQRVDGVAVTTYHSNRTVVVELGRPDVDGEFWPGLVAGGGNVTVANGAANVDSRIRTSGTVEVGSAASVTCDSGTGDDCTTERATVDRAELDWAIEQKVDAANASAQRVSLDTGSTTTIDAGRYFVNDSALLDSNDLVVDLSEGNVSLVVDGNLGVANQKIRVRNGDVNATCCYARVYVTGDVAIANGGGGVVVRDLIDGDDTNNATRFQLYGTSEMQFGLGQGQFTGAVYAPRDEPANGSNDAVAEFGLQSATSACTGGSSSGPLGTGSTGSGTGSTGTGSGGSTGTTGGSGNGAGTGTGAGGAGNGVGTGPAAVGTPSLRPQSNGPDVCIGQGNGVVTGAIVAGPMSVQQSSGFQYDPDLETVRPTMNIDDGVYPPDVSYLHISVHEVALDNR